MHGPDGQLAYDPPRRSWLRARLRVAVTSTGALGITLLTAGHARFIAPFRIQYPIHDLPVARLPAAFDGFRILHLSDLHAVRYTPLSFLHRVFQHANTIHKDLTVITGDFVTRQLKTVKATCELVAQLRGPVIATFGNHDYSETHETWASSDVAEALDRELTSRGVTVLRNRAIPIEREGQRLWIVGLEDYWSGRFDADAAFRDVKPGEPAIALSHNPDTAHFLQRFHPAWVLSGHTHGGQIRVPVAGSLVLPVQDKRLDQGFHTFGDTRLFISRGIGGHVPVRFRCPPEAPLLILKRT